MVLPDNVLFEGDAGETLRRKLLADLDLHTLRVVLMPVGKGPGQASAPSGTRTPNPLRIVAGFWRLPPRLRTGLMTYPNAFGLLWCSGLISHLFAVMDVA